MAPTRLYSGFVEVHGFEHKVELNICEDYCSPAPGIPPIETNARPEGIDDLIIDGIDENEYDTDFVNYVKDEIIEGFENGTIS